MTTTRILVTCILLSLLCLVAAACAPDDRAKRAHKLEVENQSLTRQINLVQALRVQESTSLGECQLALDKLTHGQEPTYTVRFKLSQSHFTLDPFEHVKDHMNAIEFSMPVSREFYEKVHPGSEIVDSFRAGSFLFRGSLGSWDLHVVGKHVQ